MHKTLEQLLTHVPTLQVKGSADVSIEGIAFDSRAVQEGDLFVAVRGTQADGHRFIPQAISAGAVAVVCETLPEELLEGISFVQVSNSALALGKIASAFYDWPSRELQLIGITGTNGKTTTATLLYELFMQLGYKAGLISTVENRIGSLREPATHTTPDAVSLQSLLARMLDAGCAYVFMEVSSHALEQQRLAGTDFSGAVFTNLTHDHLDYHGSFKAYLKAKKKLFDELLPKAFALINTDDKNGAVMVQNTRAKVYRYGLRQMADFKGKVLSADVHGMELLIDGVELHSPLSGEYNAYNLLAAYATARLLGMEKEETLTALSSLQGAEGRMQKVRAEGTSVLGIVDYAHTPDALEKVLSALRAGLQKGQRLLCVVGAGGDRDKAKRPKMAAIAAAYSDQLILTSDNPRSEDPDAILQDMQAGLSEEQMAKTLVIADRRQAIRTAAQLAREGDVILLAGKGHEKYQDIKGIKKPFDDVEELSKALKTRLTKEGA